MSYDLTLFHCPEGEDPEAYAERALEVDEEESADGGARRLDAAQRERLLAAANAIWRLDPTIEIHLNPPSSRPSAVAGPLLSLPEDVTGVELDAPEGGAGFQFFLDADSGSFNLAYWHEGADAERVWRSIWPMLEAAKRECGFEIYDPQLGKVLDLDADLPTVLSVYAPPVSYLRRMQEPQKRPWWKFWQR